jgi:hypothetical protein
MPCKNQKAKKTFGSLREFEEKVTFLPVAFGVHETRFFVGKKRT